MPRRNGYFQKALAVWFDANRSRFAVPMRIKMVKGGCVEITLRDQPDCINITASHQNLSVWVTWQGMIWDALIDLDVIAVKTPDGFRCAFCEGATVKIWQTRDLLWSDHLFEEFLCWVNDRYAKADCLMLYGSADSFSMAKLSCHGESGEPKDAAVQISLHPI